MALYSAVKEQTIAHDFLLSFVTGFFLVLKILDSVETKKLKLSVVRYKSVESVDSDVIESKQTRNGS